MYYILINTETVKMCNFQNYKIIVVIMYSKLTDIVMLYKLQHKLFSLLRL